MQPVLAALLITAVFAPLAAADEPAIDPASLNRFLAGVRDFAGGRLTPGPLYDPQSVGLPGGGGALGTIGVATQLNYFNTGKPASWRAANGRLATASNARHAVSGQRTVAPATTRASAERIR
jgi:hypothetical protein